MEDFSSQISVLIPSDNVPERIYAVDVLLGSILGVSYQTSVRETQKDIELKVGAKSIVVRDDFFGHHPLELDYLAESNLQTPTLIKGNPFASETDVPLLFGTEEFIIESNKIILGVDLFAASFLLLTRWEELVKEERDPHNRFPVEKHILFKDNLHLRPVVNEYAELMWNALLKSGYSGPRREKHFQMILTHDLDRIYRGPMLETIKECYKRKQAKRLLIDTLYRFLDVKVFDTLNRLVKLSKRIGSPSRFFIMAGGQTAVEGYYKLSDPIVQRIAELLLKEDQILGFHPSYDTYQNEDDWRFEKKHLESSFGISVSQGRQHYLRFDNPTTWRIWESAGMEIDSSMGFASSVGFRCGTADEFPVFDVLDRKQLQLRELPLIVMDSAVEKMANRSVVSRLKQSCEKYNMPLTVLIHNHAQDRTPWNRGRESLTDILDLEMTCSE